MMNHAQSVPTHSDGGLAQAALKARYLFCVSGTHSLIDDSRNDRTLLSLPLYTTAIPNGQNNSHCLPQ
jgi:hypothetical protein